MSSQPSFRKPEDKAGGQQGRVDSKGLKIILITLSKMLMLAARTLLHFGLTALEEVEGVGGFGVHVLHHGENVQDVLLCESRLVAAVEVVLLYQNLEGEVGRCW